MNRLLSVQKGAKIAFKATNGRIERVNLASYCPSSKNAFLRAWRKCEFPFLKTVNDLILEQRGW